MNLIVWANAPKIPQGGFGMREISVKTVTETVKRLCISANCHLPCDVKNRIETSRARETWPQAQEILDRIIENYQIADENNRPICQDTTSSDVASPLHMPRNTAAPFTVTVTSS